MNFKTFALKTLEKAALAAGAAVLAVAKEQDWSAAGKWGAPIGAVLAAVYALLSRVKGDRNSASFVDPEAKKD